MLRAVVVVPEQKLGPPSRTEFFQVANTSEIESGRARVVYLRGIEIALFNVGGTYYAVDNLCPHEGGPMVAGTIEGDSVVCPWHRWKFRLSDGCFLVNPAVKIGTYPVKIEGNLIQIGMKVD